MYKSGELVLPAGVNQYFSADNWGNKSHKALSSKWFCLIDQMGDSKWVLILNGAKDLIKPKKIIVVSSNNDTEDSDASLIIDSNDQDDMEVIPFNVLLIYSTDHDYY